VVVVAVALFPCDARAASCESLETLRLPHTSIVLAQNVARGAFHAAPAFPRPDGLVPTYADLPAFCRVAGSIKPVADSDIGFEVWLPAQDWNGKFVGVGNGGLSGEIFYWSMSEPLKRGYAVAGSDTGHRGAGDDASFALGHAEKLVDFTYRATHEMTVAGKALTAAFYGSSPAKAFFAGCSAGGRQALTEAQKYPGDYDAIAAGAPGHHWGTTGVGAFWASAAMLKTPASRLPPSALSLLHEGALDRCDAADGVTDGVIDDPRSCAFDPQALQCAAGTTTGCLNADQVVAARAIYRGPFNARTGVPIMPGLPVGSELGWSFLVQGDQPMKLIVSGLQHLVFEDSRWDYRAFDWERDVERVRTSRTQLYDATNPDVGAFVARGGKLLLYHGWTDPLIAAQNSIDYVAQVEATLGAAKTRNAVRLFLAPGMNHCSGGEGPSVIDIIGALDAWSDTGRAPEVLNASRPAGAAPRSRPLCAYPAVARYQGSGSTDDAANFVCVAK
jgi:feruloyl esterase